MADDVTPDQLVGAAEKLGKPEFTREDLAGELGVKKASFRESFKTARKAGRFKKTGENDEGAGVFKLGDVP